MPFFGDMLIPWRVYNWGKDVVTSIIYGRYDSLMVIEYKCFTIMMVKQKKIDHSVIDFERCSKTSLVQTSRVLPPAW